MMKLEENVSFLDRMIRAVLGVILFYFGITGIVQGLIGIVLMLAGILLIFSAATGFSLIYRLLGLQTKRQIDE